MIRADDTTGSCGDDAVGDGPAEAASQTGPSPDPRPPQHDVPAFCDWLLRRYVVSDWDNQFVARLKQVLKQDEEGNLLPDPKNYRDERMGIAVTAPAREGKTTMVLQVLERLLHDKVSDKRCGRHISYCRLRTDATTKSVYMDLCRTTGFSNFPAKLTRAEANDLATHRLRLAGVQIVILDELHHLLGKANEPVNLFLKTLLQDGGGFCVIALGTPKLRTFIFGNDDNDELAGRFYDLPLKGFPPGDTIALIRSAISKMCKDARLGLAPSIAADPFFPDRIYEGCRGSYGRCMRLIATSVVHAVEEGGDALDIEDFREVFELQFLHYNEENPFVLSDWAARAGAGKSPEVNSACLYFGDGPSTPLAQKRGRRRKKAGSSK